MEFKRTIKEILFTLLLILVEMKWNFVLELVWEKPPIQQKLIIIVLMN